MSASLCLIAIAWHAELAFQYARECAAMALDRDGLSRRELLLRLLPALAFAASALVLSREALARKLAPRLLKLARS